MRIFSDCRFAGRQSGFSYIWVLMMVAMLGGFMALTAEVYRTSLQRQHEKTLILIGHEFREAIRRYYENPPPGAPKVYPSRLEQLLLDDRHGKAQRYLRKIYIDPVTRSPDWGIVTVAGRIVGIHSLSSATPLKKDGFSLSEQAFKGKERYADWVFTYPADLMVDHEVMDGQKLGDNPSL